MLFSLGVAFLYAATLWATKHETWCSQCFRYIDARDPRHRFDHEGE